MSLILGILNLRCQLDIQIKILISNSICINSSLGVVCARDTNVDNSIKMIVKILRLDQISEEGNVDREELQKLS